MTPMNMRLTEGKSGAPVGEREVACTGIQGLDYVLRGGLPRNRVYLVEGSPGTGKTTLGLQFLMDGRDRGEIGLYITLSETVEELEESAHSHNWSLEGIHIRELVAGEERLAPESQYTVFDPSEVELGETIRAVLEEIERVRPSRVVFDSLSEMRLLAQNPLRYRRQILALKQFFVGRGCTVLLLDDRTIEGDEHVRSVAHGVLNLEMMPVDYGVDRRRLRVAKLRAVEFRSGFHDCRLTPEGLQVYPRLVAAESYQEVLDERLPSGLPELDALLEGGLCRGTSALLLGPAGTGKSSLVSQYAHAAAQRGETVAMYIFEESLDTFRNRARELGVPLDDSPDGGRVLMRQVDPAELSPGEFVFRVREAVEDEGVRLVVIDSLNGFLTAMSGERQLILQLHELLTYLNLRGVTTLVTEAQHGMMGAGMGTPVDVSYLADTVLLLRYFEAFGQIRQAISVIKNRTGGHERSIREFGLGPGLRVGAPLRDFHGILSGVPEYIGPSNPLMDLADGTSNI